MNILLSIDQSFTRSGLCVFNNGALVEAYLLSSNKEDDIFNRAIYVADEILKVAINHNATHISLEGLAFGMRGDATRDLAGLQFVIITTLLKSGKYSFNDITIVSPKSVKLHGGGSGKATKSDMINNLPDSARSMFEAIGAKKTTGLADLADAYWIGTHTLSNKD